MALTCKTCDNPGHHCTCNQLRLNCTCVAKQLIKELEKEVEKITFNDHIGNAYVLTLKQESEELKSLCKALLAGADRCAEKPHFIVQPFFGIVKKHAETINKHNLFGKK